MAATIGALMVDIGANVARLQHDMNRAQSTFSRSANRMKKMAAGLGVAIGAGMAVRAIVNSGKHSLEAADKYAKMSRSIGMSVESLSAYAHVAELSGTTFDTLSKATVRLAANMKDTRDGTGEAKESFQELGVSVVDSAGKMRDTNSVILDIAQRFSEMADGSRKTALAVDIFGRSGAELIPMLNAGSTGIRNMQKEAHQLGITFDTKTAQAAERVNDNMLRVNRSMGGLVNKVMVKLIPDLENMSNLMFAAAKNTAEMDFVAKTVSTSMKLMATTAVGLAAAFKSTGQSIGATAAAILLAVEGDYRAANQVLIWGAEDAATSVEQAFQRIENVWKGLPAVSDIVKTEIIKTTAEITAQTGAVTEAIMMSSRPLMDLSNNADKTKNDVQSAIASWSGSFSSQLADMVMGAKTSFKDIAKSFAAMLLEMAIRKAVFSAIMSFSGGSGFANGGVFSSGHVQAFASGGIVNSPTLFPMANGTGLMGEAGPEAIMPLTRIGGKLGVKAEGSGKSVNNISISNNLDLRGADQSAVPQLTKATDEIAQKTLVMVEQSLSRGGKMYRLTRG